MTVNSLEGTNEETHEKPKLAALIGAKNVQVDQNIQQTIEDGKEEDGSQSDVQSDDKPD